MSAHWQCRRPKRPAPPQEPWRTAQPCRPHRFCTLCTRLQRTGPGITEPAATNTARQDGMRMQGGGPAPFRLRQAWQHDGLCRLAWRNRLLKPAPTFSRKTARTSVRHIPHQTQNRRCPCITDRIAIPLRLPASGCPRLRSRPLSTGRDVITVQSARWPHPSHWFLWDR